MHIDMCVPLETWRSVRQVDAVVDASHVRYGVPRTGVGGGGEQVMHIVDRCTPLGMRHSDRS